MVLSWSPTLSPWAKSFPPYMCQPHRVSSFLLGFGRAMLMHVKVSRRPLFLKWHVSLNVGTDKESWSFSCSSKNPAMNCVKVWCPVTVSYEGTCRRVLESVTVDLPDQGATDPFCKGQVIG